MTELSLVRGDGLRRLLRALHMNSREELRYSLLIPLLIGIGWLVPGLLAAIDGRLLSASLPQAFLYDLNQPMQVLVATVLLMADPLIDERIGAAGNMFASSGLLDDHSAEFEKAAAETARLRTALWPDLLGVLVGYLLTAAWAIPEFQHAAHGTSTWKMLSNAGRASITPGGWWIVLIHSPLFFYLCSRWVVKLCIWTWFLHRMSRTDLRLAVEHPDGVGGLAFLGRVQEVFGILIFSMGLIILTDFLNQILLRHELNSNVYLSIPAFVLLAPMGFLSPLLMFTRKIVIAKEEGLTRYDVALMKCLNRLEASLAAAAATAATAATAAIEVKPVYQGPDTAELEKLEGLRGRVEKMHLVPFDLKTIGKLAATAVTPMLPIAVRYVTWAPAREFLQAIVGHS